MLQLDITEKKWLDHFQVILAKRYPGLVERIIVFGSKARGEARPDSDLDILMIIRDGDWRLKKQIVFDGLDIAIDLQVLSSIHILTRQEMDQLRKNESVFWQIIQRDGINVYDQ